MLSMHKYSWRSQQTPLNVLLIANGSVLLYCWPFFFWVCVCTFRSPLATFFLRFYSNTVILKWCHQWSDSCSAGQWGFFFVLFWGLGSSTHNIPFVPINRFTVFRTNCSQINWGQERFTDDGIIFGFLEKKKHWWGSLKTQNDVELDLQKKPHQTTYLKMNWFWFLKIIIIIPPF